MRKLQSGSTIKGLVALLMLILTFCGSMCGFRALSLLPYAEVDSWQETVRFQNLLYGRQGQLSSGVAITLALEGEELTYLERQQYQYELDTLYDQLAAENTWFRFRLLTADGETVLADNLPDGTRLEEVVDSVHYASFTAGEYWVDSSTENASQQKTPAAGGTDSASSENVEQDQTLVIECGVPLSVTDDAIQDEFSALAQSHRKGNSNFPGYLQYTMIFGGMAVLCLLYLLWAAGHKEGREEIVLSWQDRLYLEPYLVVTVTVGVAALFGIFYLAEYFYRFIFYAQQGSEDLFRSANIAASILVAVLTEMVYLTLRTLAVRLKAGQFLRTTFVCRVVVGCWKALLELIRALPFLWRAVALFVVYFLLNVLLYDAARYDGLAATGWFILNVLALALICWWALGLRNLRRGSQAIASGNLSYQIETKRLPLDLKALSEDLNNISEGLAGAVDEKMKSERFKAELITNVSHDLKTPLTSIINYVNLLKTTEQTDPKAQEYIEVLDRKSLRLKKLTEDLVEASKASTGVLSVSRDQIGMTQLIDQALGEWQEKLEDRNLTVVTSLPEGETFVYADGRHLWRVLDNLLSNCSKYAMEGTRIYLDLARGKGQVILAIKNVSREPLNVPAERLMERFVRGEESRSTEGSGLGLSIARSLTELQGGAFELAVDGDLFKAIVTLPQAN